MTPLVLGIGRSFVRTAGGGVAHGPTVQIAGTTTPLSLVHGTTGTFTATPEDINAIATGASPYWHSSDASVVRIDDATTGAYTVTGTAAQTVTITVNFVAPVASGEPAFTGAAGQNVILDTDLTEADYADASASSRYPYTVDNPSGSGVNRWVPLYSPIVQGRPVDTTANQIITDTTKWLRMINPGVGNRAIDWLLYPLQPITAVREYAATWTERWYPAVDAYPQIKRFEAWWSTISPDDSGRLQIATVPDGTGNMVWCVHDQVDAISQADLMTPYRHGLAQLTPGAEVVGAVSWKAHDRSPGTVDRLVQVVNPLPFTTDTFYNSQAGVLANGNRVKLRNAAGTADASAAEFIVSNFDGDKRATLTRAPDITGSTVSYSGGIQFLLGQAAALNVVYTGVFSVSQAARLANGDILAMNNSQGFMTSCVVQSFDGTTTCILPNYNINIDHPIQDWGGLWFSSPADQNGFVRHWVNHFKEIDISAATVDVIAPGTTNKWATKETLASLNVGGCLSKLAFGEAQANITGQFTYDVGRRISLWWKS